MDSGKGKPITSSVPSIAIRFNATDEAIEELYVTDGERGDSVADIPNPTTISDSEGSPAKTTSKLSKRSTSIDVSNPPDASPPSDPWRFFSDIKGKITKSVEGKITEYKSRTTEGENSPKTSKPNKDGKENSSLSDSEELSESSISRTCGIVSTTEGAEMSSDDETNSLSEKDKEKDAKIEPLTPTPVTVKKKFRVYKDKELQEEGFMSGTFLENLQNINMGIQLREKDDVESGVDVLLQFQNVAKEGDDIIIKRTEGADVRKGYFTGNMNDEVSIFAPIGHVDLRQSKSNTSLYTSLKKHYVYIITGVAIILYFILPLSSYIQGFIAGNLVMLMTAIFYFNWYSNLEEKVENEPSILEIPAAMEFTPPTKYEGWVNEYPDLYDPYSYHISQTQPVFLRLQGNLLKISHTKAKIPKRAMWNEVEHRHTFIRHRLYNLLGAKVHLVPVGLTKIRHWSKKYPICISLESSQYNFDYPEKVSQSARMVSTRESVVLEKHKKKSIEMQQVFSKLNDESESSTEYKAEEDEDAKEKEDALDPDAEFVPIIDYFNEEDVEEWSGEGETNIYIFARTDREKEHWFRRLTSATHKQETHSIIAESSDIPLIDQESTTIIANKELHKEYLKFMSNFFQAVDDPITSSAYPPWLNALVTRVAFDLIRNPNFVAKLKERIQRKLSAIRLPYFIEELTLTELFLGNNAPTVDNLSMPKMDEWGLWVDMHVAYEGNVRIILQTKLNLMKLKQPPVVVERKTVEKSPIFHSDVDDSAESSSDEEQSLSNPPAHQGPGLDASGNPLPGLGGTSNRGKKFFKMVDRIAESKFFQAASEYKYIKRAIEGVSNTDLGLKVEVQILDGTMVLNIPTPPSDRVWVGFRPTPKLVLRAQPIVGERNISFMQVTSWIEKKLAKEFQKFLVIPNMEDLYISVMMQTLPK